MNQTIQYEECREEIKVLTAKVTFELLYYTILSTSSSSTAPSTFNKKRNINSHAKLY